MPQITEIPRKFVDCANQYRADYARIIDSGTEEDLEALLLCLHDEDLCVVEALLGNHS